MKGELMLIADEYAEHMQRITELAEMAKRTVTDDRRPELERLIELDRLNDRIISQVNLCKGLIEVVVV